jgi:peptide/nickel transport system permease protein
VDFLSDFWRICKSDKPALVAGVVILIYLVVAIFGPIFVHLSPIQNPADAYLSPSWHHPLGTDYLGQDVLTELVIGTRPVLEVGLLTAIFAVGVGVTVGLVAGYLGGALDMALMRLADVFLTIPGLPLVIVIAAIVRTSSPLVLAAILAITAWAGLARAVRSQALSLRSADFIEAAKVQGLPLRNMIGRQLLPNVGPYVAINFLLAVTGAIYAEVGLFVLGVAPVSSTSNWGVMINLAMGNGALYTTKSMLYLFTPMAAIVFLQVALVFFTRALDQLFNPRLRVQS